MEVLRHQDPADEQKSKLVPGSLESLREKASVGRISKDGNTPVGAGGDKLEMAGLEGTMIKGAPQGLSAEMTEILT
jgi:hypothetical protein